MLKKQFLKIFKIIHFCLLAVIGSQLLTVSCNSIDLYEKTVTLPNHEWNSSYQPEFTFVIKDTAALYQVYFVIRHSEKYNYNNIWIHLHSQPPGDTLHVVPYELKLATNEKGWLASGMDDIYEHRIKLTDSIKLKAGDYKLGIEHIMREDPLMQVLSVGIRVEKKQ